MFRFTHEGQGKYLQFINNLIHTCTLVYLFTFLMSFVNVSENIKDFILYKRRTTFIIMDFF